MIADLESDTAVSDAADKLKAMIGCDTCVIAFFDRGRQFAALAQWGGLEHADRVNIERAHEPTEQDYAALADKLKAWHAGRP